MFYQILKKDSLRIFSSISFRMYFTDKNVSKMLNVAVFSFRLKFQVIYFVNVDIKRFFLLVKTFNRILDYAVYMHCLISFFSPHYVTELLPYSILHLLLYGIVDCLWTGKSGWSLPLFCTYCCVYAKQATLIYGSETLYAYTEWR